MDHKETEVEDLERVFTDENAEPIQISYAVVKSITKNFGQVIGHGAFGVVYLGAVRSGLVAVKKISHVKDFSDTQYLEEVKCLKKVNHENIVRFLGYCADTQGVVMDIEGQLRIVDVQQRLLCFEYVPNGSLHRYLQEKKHGYEWNTCYQIIKGICQGLHHLHQVRIHHLDLKPANVLLGPHMKPKITDFGLSRCIDGNQSTIFTSNLCGTPGFIAPELIDEKKISFKSDIFSLGIIMIRLLTGNSESVPENWQESLKVDCLQMKKCIEIAHTCADYDPSKRPTTSEIIYMLSETERTVQNVPPVITEPRYDPTSALYQVVARFWTLPTQTPHDFHRWLELEMPAAERPMWKLSFRCPPLLPIYTGRGILDERGSPLEIILVNIDTGLPSTLQQELHIELVTLSGDFPKDESEHWSADDFNRSIIGGREGKRPLLHGNVDLVMRHGRVPVHRLQFTDGSTRFPCFRFRIGVRVVPGSYHGSRILEATTEAFVVKDVRGASDSKHYPPMLKDDVWRVENIRKEGVFHRRLTQNHIMTVQDFLVMLVLKPDELRAILGKDISNMLWRKITDQAKTCDVGDKVYAYTAEHGTIYVNSIFQLLKVEIGGLECPLPQLDGAQAMFVRRLTMEAYEHRQNLQEVDQPILHGHATVPLLQSGEYAAPQLAPGTIDYHANPVVQDDFPAPQAANMGDQW